MADSTGIGARDILPEDALRIVGDEARGVCLSAGQAVADALSSTLGPRGMDKMLVDGDGDFVVTNDGVTVLRWMDIEHPAANMIVEVADAQEAEVGDGTTTAVVIAGDLLALAGDLLETGVHPTAIVRGYRQAADRAIDRLEELAVAFDVDDSDALAQLVETVLAGYGDRGTSPLAEVLVDAARRVADQEGFDARNVKIEAITGATVDDSNVVDGVAIGREPVHEMMPTRIEDASIALVGDDVDIRESVTGVTATVTAPDQIQEFYDREEEEARALTRQLLDAGPDAVFVEGAVHERVRQLLADRGILCIRRVNEDDLRALARATGAEVSNLEDLDSDSLGWAGRIEQRDTGHDEHVFVEDVPGASSVTVFLRGGSREVVDDLERAVDDALAVLEVAFEERIVLPGGGAPEAAAALELRRLVDSVDGREQLAVEAFADALEVVPWTLAENSGMDALDTVLELRAAHAEGRTSTGIDGEDRKLADASARGIIESLRVKTRAIESATEAATMLLRIDAVITADELAGGAIEPETMTPDEVSEETVERNEEFIEEFEG